MIRLPRPLPLAIAGMGLLAVVKVGGLVQSVAITTPARASAPAHAAPASAEPRSRAAPPPVAVAPPEPPQPPPVSEAERAVLQDLRARRTQLESKSQELDARQAMLTAAERRLADRVAQLSALQTKLEQLESGRRERDEANWRGLVKTYETMRPRDAAAIFNELESPVLLQVLDRMKEAKAAPILAAMAPERARAATAQLAEHRSHSSAAPNLSAPDQGAKP
jgi:flagellar motility protein MotE (MotC chaperone)